MIEIEKPWGKERIRVKNRSYVIKEIHVNAGKRLSLQYHKEKVETLFFKSGYGYIEINDLDIPIGRFGDMIHIPPEKVHRIKASPFSDLVLMEVSSPELDDVVRLEDDYGRIENE